MPIQTLTRWLSIYRKDGEKGFVGSGKHTSNTQAEADLEKRLRDLEEKNKILKKAMHIFAKDQK
ncbi:transposase [Staphylococcus delphini]|nr:transposase [Staphylococcus delphini]